MLYIFIVTLQLLVPAIDRSIILYDARETGPLRKVFMKLRVNKLAWNPMEAITFTCASEDYKYVCGKCFFHVKKKKDNWRSLFFFQFIHIRYS